MQYTIPLHGLESIVALQQNLNYVTIHGCSYTQNKSRRMKLMYVANLSRDQFYY